ncbi:tRNA dihydrouridine synthase DusB [Nannocystis punicea]|uniref:tRNA-dihydrouridine synthase n=1 Tax=Nannocystis punicea TaxID=2995304 RepID=A0ABY7H075_9BACT|nr:tRNA dihydrouridine synthase DusB [Nannocystis poenicansa]WAS92633.1 tRNA dihydrouridine synthase DusB [Nannocystis poenicansa]
MTTTEARRESGSSSALQIGPLRVWPPVVLAPMAGITNYPFRALCRRFGAGLYVSEMITAGPLVRGDARSLQLSDFGADESPRSLQLYGVDPATIAGAVRFLVGEGRVDHIDLNFGCPVRKVTRKGGGSAIPVKPNLLRAIVRAAVKAAGAVPVTMKFRMGIDEALLTYLQAGAIGEAEGCAAVALHARTAAQLYSGSARWEAIAALKQAVRTIPVLGNGDIWEASDAMRMVQETGCDGVVVGRGCLGRPWLFRELAAAFAGAPPPAPPSLGEVWSIMLEHAERLCAWMSEEPAMAAFRKHARWYTLGFHSAEPVVPKLMQASRLAELAALASEVDPSEPFPAAAARLVRGKSGPPQKVALPHGYLDDLDDATPPGPDAEDADSGG